MTEINEEYIEYTKNLGQAIDDILSVCKPEALRSSIEKCFNLKKDFDKNFIITELDHMTLLVTDKEKIQAILDAHGIALKAEETHKLYEDWVERHLAITDLIIQSDSHRIGEKVIVHDGNGKVCLGEGTFVGYATVYYLCDNKTGTLKSNTNAEEKPDLLEGHSLVCSRNNPKIILDSGKTVYGCQVWWDFKQI